MKFVELKRTLKDKIENCYLLKGDDPFLLDRSYSLIYDALNMSMDDLNVSKFSEQVDFEDVVKALNTLPVFVKYRLVYVKLSSKDFKNEKQLGAYFESVNPTSVLVVDEGNDDLLKSFAKEFTFVDCNRLSKEIVFPFVASELKKYGKTISKPACELLCDYTNNDLSKINNELIKLAGYIGDRDEISVDDIEKMVTKSTEFQIFELTEALARKNSKKVYDILEVMKSRKDEFRTLHPLIYKHFRRLFFVSITSGTRADLAKMLGVQEYAITKSQEQAKLFTKRQLKEINDICIQLDYDLKNSNITVNNAIDLLVLKILNYK